MDRGTFTCSYEVKLPSRPLIPKTHSKTEVKHQIDTNGKSNRGGMYHGYSVSHEKFVWDVRTEPLVVDAFAKIWGTDKLLVSFDGINLTLPQPERAVPQRWPHQDQDSTIRGFQCAQGIVNLVCITQLNL